MGNDGHYVSGGGSGGSGGGGGGGADDLALLEESPGSIMEKVSMECAEERLSIFLFLT